jgi:hypothetical protein
MNHKGASAYMRQQRRDTKKYHHAKQDGAGTSFDFGALRRKRKNSLEASFFQRKFTNKLLFELIIKET